MIYFFPCPFLLRFLLFYIILTNFSIVSKKCNINVIFLCINFFILDKIKKNLWEAILKKGYIFLVIGLIVIGIGVGIYFYNTKENEKSNRSDTSNYIYDSTRVSTNNELNANTDISSQNSNVQETENLSSADNGVHTSSAQESEPQKQETETQISDFTTKIYTKDSERQNNISITCSTLNDTIINDGETFSFCDTVGKATSSKGYEKADVYQDGEVVQALGGGNCQVSTTLYNAVLEVENLTVTERHEHSNSVPYVDKGKDAAVAYGSYDFKFVNHTGSKIKISASCDNDFVYIKIFKIS